MMDPFRERAIKLLRWSERYTKTDMVYLAGAGLWTNLNFAITSILALALSIAFANLLPRETYGEYQYLLSFSALLTALCLAGMNNAVSQSVARGFEGDLKEGVGAQIAWSIVPISIGFVCAAYYEIHGNQTLALGLVIVAVLSPLVNAFSTYLGFLSGKRDFKRTFIFGSILNVAYYGTMFVALSISVSVVTLIAINLGVNALIALLLYRRVVTRHVANNETDPSTISYGRHLSAMNAFGTIITQLDSLLVFHFLGPVQLSVYAFASMIPERIGGFFSFIATAAFPKYAKRSREEIRQNILSQTVRAFIPGICAAILYVLAAPLLFKLFFPQYLDAVRYTQVYALVIVFMSSNLASSALMAQRMKLEMYVSSFANPLTLIFLQVPLLLAYGIMGMLVARIISDAINTAITLALLFRAPRNPAEAGISR